MKVLFIGGTGAISRYSAELAIARGIELHLMTRGQSARPLAEGAHLLHLDFKDTSGEVEQALENHYFDAVVNWICYHPDQAERDVNLFRGKCGQYIFISSASVYQKPVASLPITESTPAHNPFWQYSREKIACEERLLRAYREEGFPVTIVRPSHTYDERMLPFQGGWTVLERLRRGQPAIVHGDGTSLWVLTHSRDFAKGFVPLLGHPAALGGTYHITSDELLTWNQIFTILARQVGVENPALVHVPSEVIARYHAGWGSSLLGDKAHSVIFDNSKIRRLAPDFVCTTPFARGAEEVATWFLHDPARQVVNAEFDALQDRILGDLG
jgi:nucleoside-diphosphate-sugar epimerase